MRERLCSLNRSKLIFLIGMVVCLPLRVWHKFSNIDSATGFYLNKDVTVTAYYGILSVSLIGILCFSLFLMRNKTFAISASRTLSVLSVAVGIAILASGGLQAWQFYQNYISVSGQAGLLVPTVLIGILFFFSVFSGVVFLRLAIGYAKEDITNRGSYTFLIPILWALAYCVLMYTDYPQIADMPDRVLYLFCLLSFTVFLVGQGRILSDVNMDKGVCYVCGFGLTTALSGLLLIVGEAVSFTKGTTLPLFDLALAFCISVYALVFSWSTAPLLKKNAN